MIACAAYAAIAVIVLGAPLLIAAARRVIVDFIESFEEDE